MEPATHATARQLHPADADTPDDSWVGTLAEELGTLRRRLGDLDCALLLATLASEGPETSALRLASLTGIPRQTVRRKLQALARHGLIEQLPSHAWRLVPGTAGIAALRPTARP